MEKIIELLDRLPAKHQLAVILISIIIISLLRNAWDDLGVIAGVFVTVSLVYFVIFKLVKLIRARDETND